MIVVLSLIIYYPQIMRKLIIALSIILLSSCVVTESIKLDGRSGSSTTDINVEQFFIDVLEDFSEFLPEDNQSIMDSAMTGFASQLNDASATTKVSLYKTGENAYYLDFAFSDIQRLIKELGAENAEGLISVTDSSFSFYVDIDNFDDLTKIVPFLADPNFEVYGPLYNQGTTEEDYLDMIYFLLGEEGPDAIRNGHIAIDITVPGTITAAEGAKKTGSNTARFEFPIIDFLLLNEPLTFSLNWK